MPRILRATVALTEWRPWDWAILYAGKPVENRSWPMPENLVGVPVAIHAGKRYDQEAATFLRDDPAELGMGLPVPDDADLPAMAITGIVVFGRSVRYVDLLAGELTPWHSGPWCWPILEAHPLPRPVWCRGAQGLWRCAPVEVEVTRAAS